MNKKLPVQIAWLAALGSMLTLTSLGLMRLIPMPLATGLGLLALFGAWAYQRRVQRR